MIIKRTSFSQDVADSTIVKVADFNCRCEDTIKTELENEVIKLQIMDCLAKSLVTYSNTGEIS